MATEKKTGGLETGVGQGRSTGSAELFLKFWKSGGKDKNIESPKKIKFFHEKM